MDRSRQAVRDLIAKQTQLIDAAVGSDSRDDLAERIELTRRACRSAMTMLALRADVGSVLDYRDPLPDSTVEALARLNETKRRGSR